MRARARATILKYRLQTTNILRTTAALGYSRVFAFDLHQIAIFTSTPIPNKVRPIERQLPAGHKTRSRCVGMWSCWLYGHRRACADICVNCEHGRCICVGAVCMAAGSCHCTGGEYTKYRNEASKWGRLMEANEPLNYATAEQRIEMGGAEQRHCASVQRRSSQVNWKIPIDQ